jgi:hypothetical protein
MKHLTFLGFACLAASLAATAGPVLPVSNNVPRSADSGSPPAADSIHIKLVTPASGNFPTSGPPVVIDFHWFLSSAADGQIAAFFTSAPAPGPGQTGLGASFSPRWVSRGSGLDGKTVMNGSGDAQITLAGSCSDTTVPAGTITEIRVVLSKSSHQTGPIGPELAKDTKTVQYKYACPVAQRGQPEKGLTLGGAKPTPTVQPHR